MVSSQMKHVSQIGSFHRILAGSNITCTSIQTTFKPPHRVLSHQEGEIHTCALFFWVKIPSISCGLTPLQVGNEALPTAPLVPGCFKHKTIETGGGISEKIRECRASQAYSHIHQHFFTSISSSKNPPNTS